MGNDNFPKTQGNIFLSCFLLRFRARRRQSFRRRKDIGSNEWGIVQRKGDPVTHNLLLKDYVRKPEERNLTISELNVIAGKTK